jgi:hypothetical protein
MGMRKQSGFYRRRFLVKILKIPKDRIKSVVKNHDDKNKLEKNIVINYEVR